MKLKKAIACLLAVVLLVMSAMPAMAADVSKIDEYKALFKSGRGPEVDSIVTDYMYFAPQDDGSGKKYPLIVYFHGMGQGSEPGAQIEENNLPLWASEEMQSKFTNGGAFLFVPRAHEDEKHYWGKDYVGSVKAALDEFIAANKDRIDLSRIYVGGFSMGGKMTLIMATSFPGLFAAAFPMCPAYTPTDAQLEAIADMPVWLIVSRYDVIAGYHTYSKDIWERLCEKTNIPGSCRLSLMGKVCFPDGKKCQSNHHVWFAASNDMFMYDGSDYVNMETSTASGSAVKLGYPDGLINWLCSFTSDYDGGDIQSNGLCEENNESFLRMVWPVIRAIFFAFTDTVKALFKK